MPFTVGDALKLEVMHSCRVLTGSAGLQNKVRWVNIIEILDDLSHIEAGEFLITTAYDLNMENETRQRELIDYFTQKGLAALAIQTGYYIQEVPPFFIKLAAARGIAVIEIPFETSFKKLTRGLLGELMRRNGFQENTHTEDESNLLKERMLRSRELLQRLRSGGNPDDFRDDLLKMQLAAEAAFYIVAIKALPLEAGKIAGREQEGPLLMEPALIHLAIQHKLPFLAGPIDGTCMLLLQGGKQPPEQLLPVIRRILGELNIFFPQFKFAGGLSSMRHHLIATDSAIGEAERALHIAELGLVKRGDLLSYDDLGIYKILPEVRSMESLKSLYQESIAPLLDYDRRTGGALTQTLRTYLNCLNMSRAAQELFVHRHTLKYRLNQIEELTGMPLELPGNVFKLHLGLLIYDYLQARGAL